MAAGIAVLAGAFGGAPAGTAQIFPHVFSSGFLNEGLVPDGSLAGWSDTRTMADSGFLGEVVVWLDVRGGFNSDLYAYLSHDGVLVPLVNRVGLTAGDDFGYGEAGFNVRFQDGSPRGDFHFYQNVPGYASGIADGSFWEPDGRTTPPTTLHSSDFDGATRTPLSAFRGLSLSGDWTLFVADVSGGGGATTVASWGLEFTAAAAVPEPSTTVALSIVLGFAGAWRLRSARR